MAKTNYPDLTPEQVAELKEKNPGVRFYAQKICGDRYIYRAITGAEWVGVQSLVRDNPNLKQSDLDEKCVSLGLVYPRIPAPEWSQREAGVVPTLAAHIRAKSGFLEPGITQPGDLLVETLVEQPEGERPTPEEVEALRGRTEWALHLLRVNGIWFVFRPILRLEWRNLFSEEVPALDSGDDKDLQTCQRCVLWSSGGKNGRDVDWLSLPAGVVSTLARFILEHSGFGSESEAEEL